MGDWEILENSLIITVKNIDCLVEEKRLNLIEEISSVIKFVKKEYKTFNPMIYQDYRVLYTSLSELGVSDMKASAKSVLYEDLYETFLQNVRLWSMNTKYY